MLARFAGFVAAAFVVLGCNDASPPPLAPGGSTATNGSGGAGPVGSGGASTQGSGGDASGVGGAGGTASAGGMGGSGGVGPKPEFQLPDVNPSSPSFNTDVGPSDYLAQVSAWYFGHGT